MLDAVRQVYLFIARNQHFKFCYFTAETNEFVTRSSSVNSNICSEKNLSGSPGIQSSISDVTDTSSSINQGDVNATAADRAVEAVEEDSVHSITISSGSILSRPRLTLTGPEFQALLNKTWTSKNLSLYLEANFPVLFQIKKDYLDNISHAVTKTKSNALDVRFEDIEEHVSFLSSSVQPLIQEVMDGFNDKRRKREKFSTVNKNDNSHRCGFLKFIQVIWQGLGIIIQQRKFSFLLK
jgi:hypothetical protein